MAALRFVAGLFALVAVIALVADATPVIELGRTFEPRSLLDHWQAISPKSLAAAQKSIESGTLPLVWTVLETAVLGLPTFVLFGLLAALCGYLGRIRREIEIFIN